MVNSMRPLNNAISQKRQSLLMRAVNLNGKLKEENLIKSHISKLKTQEDTKFPITSINFTESEPLLGSHKRIWDLQEHLALPSTISNCIWLLQPHREPLTTLSLDAQRTTPCNTHSQCLPPLL